MRRETFGRPAARFPLRWSRGERVGKEIVQWAPSRWNATKIKHYLKRVRYFLLTSEWACLGNQEAVTSAVMTVDVALSELEMIHRKCFRLIESKPTALGFRETLILPPSGDK